MKKLWLWLATLSVAASFPAAASVYTYTAGLNQQQEVSVTVSNVFAAGVGKFTFDDATGVFTWEIDFSNLTGSVTGAHIHTAPAGSNGPIVIDLSNPTPGGGSLSNPAVVDFGLALDADIGAGTFGEFNGEALLDSAVFGALTGGIGEGIALYVNLHTAANPGGEIRGQLFVFDIESAQVPLPAAVWMLFPALGLVRVIGHRKGPNPPV